MFPQTIVSEKPSSANESDNIQALEENLELMSGIIFLPFHTKRDEQEESDNGILTIIFTIIVKNLVKPPISNFVDNQILRP